MTAAFHRFVTDRLEAYRDRPQMWGSNEALEISALTLMEAEIQHYCPEALENNPRVLIETWHEELAVRFGGGHLPLFERVKETTTFAQTLFSMCHKVRYELGAILTIWGPGGKATYIFPLPAAEGVPTDGPPADANFPEMGAEERADFLRRINS